MKLLSDKRTSQTLKLLVACTLGKADISLEIISSKDPRIQSPGRLPILLLDSGEQIFSSNAATCLLLEKCHIISTSQVQQWLEWEAVKLQPLVSAYIMNLSNEKKSELNEWTSQLKNLLKYLSEYLKDRQYILETSMTAADIVVWATLYPLTLDQNISKILPINVLQWLSNLSSHEAFQEAVRKLAPQQNMEEWNSSSHQLSVQLASLSIAPFSIKGAHNTLPQEVGNKLNSQNTNSAKTISKPVLPEPGKRNILITSALPYVNNVPHLGNIIGCVLSADVFARYCRARGYNTLYISGTDEYGTATETKAIAEGMTPRQICDKYHQIHAQVYKWFNIEFDFFGRTSSQQHTEICQDIFLKLYKNELTLTESMDQLLCQTCNRFLADRFVEGECPFCGYEDARGDQCDKCGRLVNATELRKPRCKLCQQPPVTRASTHFFLDLPKVEPRLREWMAVSSPGWSNNASVIAQTWIKDGLKPRCITRDLKWGIPVPLDGYRDKVFYVWFDAPLGYVSMTKCYTDEWEKWWKNPKEVEYFQFMAKDNVPFHAVMFPSTQLGSGDNFTIVNHIVATEYLNYEESKFSKSRGVGVFGSDVQDTGISADIWRFYLLYVRPESQDSSFSWIDLMTKNNSELLNNLGNFINRALMFVEKFFNCIVPDVLMSSADKELEQNINSELQGFVEAMEKNRLRDGLRHILAISRHGNQYIQTNQPWVLVKGADADRDRAGSIVGLCANIVCLLAAQLRPYMPDTANIIDTQLSAPPQVTFSIPDHFAVMLPKGHTIGKPAPLFTKIETTHVEKLRSRFAGDQQAQAERAATETVKPKSSVSNNASVVIPQDLASLKAAVSAQGEKLRKLKAETKDKIILMPEISKLLELKKNLAEAEKNEVHLTDSNSVCEVHENLTALENAIVAQGEVVRKLKAQTKDKSVWQPEVDKLLELKKKLVQAGGAPSQSPKGSGKKKK